MPRRAAVPMTERTAAKRSAPQSERKPPVTLGGGGGTQSPFASVVVGDYSRRIEEGEQVIANLTVSAAQSPVVPVWDRAP